MHRVTWSRIILHLAQVGFPLVRVGFSLVRADFLWSGSYFLWSGPIFDLDQKNQSGPEVNMVRGTRTRSGSRRLEIWPGDQFFFWSRRKNPGRGGQILAGLDQRSGLWSRGYLWEIRSGPERHLLWSGADFSDELQLSPSVQRHGPFRLCELRALLPLHVPRVAAPHGRDRGRATRHAGCCG